MSRLISYTIRQGDEQITFGEGTLGDALRAFAFVCDRAIEDAHNAFETAGGTPEDRLAVAKAGPTRLFIGGRVRLTCEPRNGFLVSH